MLVTSSNNKIHFNQNQTINEVTRQMGQNSFSSYLKLNFLSLKWIGKSCTVWSELHISRFLKSFIWSVILYKETKEKEKNPVTKEKSLMEEWRWMICADDIKIQVFFYSQRINKKPVAIFPLYPRICLLMLFERLSIHNFLIGWSQGMERGNPQYDSFSHFLTAGGTQCTYSSS
jgi:hypothetical protein